MKILFFDLETTGLIAGKNGIHQLSGQIFIGREMVKEFNFKFKPHPLAVITEEALRVSHLTTADLAAREMTSTQAYLEFVEILGMYVDKFSRTDKFFLCGYNNAAFDNQFIREFFLENGDKYFGSWFWSNSMDAMSMASVLLAQKRHKMENFKLVTVARAMGLEVDESRAHDGLYDTTLTRQIFEICMGTWYAPRQTPG